MRSTVYHLFGPIFFLLIYSCQPAKPALESYRRQATETNTIKEIRQELINYSRGLIGCKYKTEGKSKSGFDCSGFVIHVYREFKIPMAASANQQVKQGKEIPLKEAEAGDLIFFGSKNNMSHVGIITLNQTKKLMLIHSTSSRGVIEEDILKSDYWLRRIQKVVSLESYMKSTEVSFLYKKLED